MLEEQLGSYFFYPALSDVESHYSSMLPQVSTTTKLSLAAGQVGRTKQWSGLCLDKCWKEIRYQLAVGERTERPLEVRALQKMPMEHWQGESSACSSCAIFYYLGDGTLLESIPWRCLHQMSPEVFNHFTADTGIQNKIHLLPDQGRERKCTRTVSSHCSGQCLQEKAKWLLLFWIYLLWWHLFLSTKWNQLFIQTN